MGWEGYTISYIPWESQLSGEVGGYPQALLKVVNLQGMLNFHRNFVTGQKESKVEVVLLGAFRACMELYMYRTQAETKMAGGHRKK